MLRFRACVIAQWFSLSPVRGAFWGRALGAGGLLLFCLLPAAVRAQTAVTTTVPIQRLSIQLMPEFDDPRLLVVVQGRLPDDVTLPQTLTFRIPRGAQVNQMAVIDMSNGRPAAQPYEVSDDPVDPRWSLATYRVNGNHFFFEYYVNAIGTEANRRFTFTFSAVQTIHDLALEVQRPRLAEEFATEPPAQGERLGSFGLSFYQLAHTALETGQETAVTVQYRKTDPTPSVPRQKSNSNPVTAVAPGNLTPLWLTAALAIVALSGLAGFSWWRRKPAPGTRTSFCPQCGARQRLGARYCHACGTEL